MGNLEGAVSQIRSPCSTADPYQLMLVRWTRGMKLPARELPKLLRHAERRDARQAGHQHHASLLAIALDLAE
jgi:hypothetical protein